MAYGSAAAVKERLDISTGDTSQDARITRALTQAGELIDNELKDFTGVPLTAPPQIITDIANDWAAGLVQEEIGENPSGQTPVEPIVFVKPAKEHLARYIAQTYEDNSTPVIYEQPVE